MPSWIRNIPETWANRDGWRTDIALSTLQSSAYTVAEFRLANGSRVRIPMEEMRRALSTANVRNNGMVGPFNVNPGDETVNGRRVSMELVDTQPTVEVERQIPTTVTPELLNDDGSFIEFGAFLVRYRRPALSEDDLRTAHRALRKMYSRRRLEPAASETPQDDDVGSATTAAEASTAELKTSQRNWFSALAKAYKRRDRVVLKDDAGLGVDPRHQTLFMMAVRAKLSMNEITAACIALGMAVAGIGLVVAAIIDPEPTSKLGLMVGGGIALIATGGLAAIRILVNVKPPSVRVSPKGFEIRWD